MTTTANESALSPPSGLVYKADLHGTASTKLRHELLRIRLLQLAYDCRARHEECRGLLQMKHVSLPYGNCSHRQFYVVEVEYDFFDRSEAETVPCKSTFTISLKPKYGKFVQDRFGV